MALGIVSRMFEPDIEFDFWLIRSRISHRSALYDDFTDFVVAGLKELNFNVAPSASHHIA
jgi:hypothetical protein